MAALSGEFAIIMLVSGEPQALDGIRAGRGALSERTGLTVLMRRPGTEPGKKPAERTVLTASCLDHPGVVHQLTSVLSEEEQLALQQRVERALREATGLSMRIQIVESGGVPRSEGKAVRVIDRRPR